MAQRYDYTDNVQMIDMVVKLVTIDSEVKRGLIEQLLHDSSALSTGAAGTKGIQGTTYFRPYYVAARQLQRNRADQTLKKGDGAEFTNLFIMVQSFLEEQVALDAAYGLEVPSAYNSQLALDAHCGCDLKASCCGDSGTGTTAGTYLAFPTAFVV